MKILYLTHAYPPHSSGVGSFVQSLARGLVAEGHQVWVMETYHPSHGLPLGHRQDVGVEVVPFGESFRPFRFMAQNTKSARIALWLAHKTQFFLLLLLWQARCCGKAAARLAVQEGIEILEIPDGNESGAFITRLPAGTKLIARLHGSVHLQEAAGVRLYRFPKREIYKMLERRVIQSAQGLVAVSRYVARQAAKIFHLQKPVEVIYNSLEPTRQTQPAQKALTVLFAGRLSYDKGVDTLMLAWNEVQPLFPQMRLLLAGEGDPKPFGELLTPAAYNTVDFLGPLPREALFDLMTHTQCFVLPARYESFGLVLLEAMQRGCPIVGTSIASGPELIEEGISGLLAHPNNPAAFAVAIKQVLENPELRQQLRTGALERSRMFTNRAAWIAQNVFFYKKVLQKEN